MAFCLTVATAVCILMVGSILVKPYVKVKGVRVPLYSAFCVGGAILLLISGALPFSKALAGITADTAVNPLKILALFISMTLISVFLGDAGFFDFIADKVFSKSKGGAFGLFFALYIVVSILTVFTSNDIIILTFTPPICIFASKAKISPLPFLFGEFVAANTWSIALIVGNPTNIYLAESAGIGFFEYFKVMILPATAAGIGGLCALLLIFGKTLKNMKIVSQSSVLTAPNATQCVSNADITNNTFIGEIASIETKNYEVRKIPLIVALFHLITCIALLAVSDFIGIEMWLICVCLALSLTLFNAVYDFYRFHSEKSLFAVLKKAPYELIPFVLSMFIIVLALQGGGVTDKLSEFLVSGKKTDGFLFGLLSAIFSNFFNNIPMSVLFEKIVSGKSLAAVYGSIIGSNVGALFTPVGALAGIMWNKLLSERGISLPFWKFALYGTPIAFVSLAAACLALLLVL